ncbi:TPA: hypothetical protein ACHT12_005192 [Klebsiella variicola]
MTINIKQALLALLIGLVLSFVATSAFSAERADKSNQGVSQIENQTKVYENTTAGKERAEWSKGRVIAVGDSVSCYNPALNRVNGVKVRCS